MFRASKTLYSVNWSGFFYEAHVSTDEAMKRFLDESGLDTIIRQAPANANLRRHEILLTEQLESPDSAWRSLDSTSSSGLQIYERVSPNPIQRRPVTLYMKSRWGVDVQIPADHDGLHVCNSLAIGSNRAEPTE